MPEARDADVGTPAQAAPSSRTRRCGYKGEQQIASRLKVLAAFSAAYLLAAWASQKLFIAPDLGAALWLPSGLFLATLLLSPRRHWSWLVTVGFVSDFMASTLVFEFPGSVAAGVALGNALEASAGAYMLYRWSGGNFKLDSTASILAFTLRSGLLSPMLSTLIGGTAMSLHTAQPLLSSWALWWTGDAAGVLVFAPLVLAFFGRRSSDDLGKPAASSGEVLALLAALVVAAHVLLSKPYPTTFLLLPFLIWAALRGEHRAIALANIVATVLIVLYTQHGLGPFAADYPLETSQFLVQVFIMAAALTGLLLAGLACQRRRSAAELAAARAAAETALAAAEKASQAKSTFLAHMSHELRTPLNAVIGCSHLLTTMQLPFVAAGYVTHIHRAGQQLLALVTDVLDFSRIEGGGMYLRHEPFDFMALLDAVRADIEPQSVAKGLTADFTFSPALPSCLWGDAQRLRQVLLNLLENAVKFTPAGRIGLSVSQHACEDGYALLRFDVVDTGIGIDPTQQQRIFEPFVQADDSTTRCFGGTGLGLSIVRRLVALIDGSLELQSVLGQGSTFSVTLPFKPPADEP